MYINMYRLRFKAEQHFTVAFSQNQNCTNSILCAILVEHNKFDVHKKSFFKKCSLEINVSHSLCLGRGLFLLSVLFMISYSIDSVKIITRIFGSVSSHMTPYFRLLVGWLVVWSVFLPVIIS